MIARINKIKNLGIFRDYKWDANLEDFCRYNLIYGWNGCGKTTLSKLFTALEPGKIDKYTSLEYEVETPSNRWKQNTNFDEKVRVFNRDYVLANVEKIGGPNPIFILGDENKKLVTQIEQDEKTLQSRTEAIERAEKDQAALTDRRDAIFTDIARTISQNVSGESTRTYRRPNAESDFQQLTPKQVLGEKELELHKATLAQQEKPALGSLPSFDELKSDLDILHDKAGSLLKQQVSSVVIQRLADHSDIADWVEQGITLYESHKSKNCEFCNRPLAQDRLHELANHFNDADKALKTEIDKLLEKLRSVFAQLRDLQTREASNVYDEMTSEYQTSLDELTSARDTLVKSVELLGTTIAAKKSQTTEGVTITSTIDVSVFVAAIKKTNALIAKHNTKSTNFEKEKEAARTKLKEHYLSEISDSIIEIDGKLKSGTGDIKKLTDGDPKNASDKSLKDLKQEITDSRAKISSSHKGCKQLNEKLEQFLGRSELVFEVSGEGYAIKRFGELADDLSEGEKTAIAFVYFVVQLSDQDFNLKDGIVVIDDPISSLDSNSLFQAFAFLKDSVKDAKQVFILTHNFEFMRQVKNWFFHIKKVGGKFQRSFYMINNKEVDDKRCAVLAPLDKLLMEFESEYHYLFSLLHTFKEDGSLESIYNFPNIGRKFLETFLAFKVPSHENIHEKMSHITYDESKKTAVLRFVETHSHAERSDGVLNFDMTLSNGGQKAIKELLAMVESVDNTHYQTLINTTL